MTTMTRSAVFLLTLLAVVLANRQFNEVCERVRKECGVSESDISRFRHGGFTKEDETKPENICFAEKLLTEMGWKNADDGCLNVDNIVDIFPADHHQKVRPIVEDCNAKCTSGEDNTDFKNIMCLSELYRLPAGIE